MPGKPEFMEATGTTSDTSEREVVISRTFDAPRELVFKAWTDPKLLAQWWGPHNFTNPICEVDLRSGGNYTIVMRDPEGTDYPIKGVFTAVDPPNRLAWVQNLEDHPDEWKAMLRKSFTGAGEPVLEILLEVRFEDLGGKTKLTVTMQFATRATQDAFVKLQMNEGWSQSFEKLQALLTKK